MEKRKRRTGRSSLTIKQKRFLIKYAETFNCKEACEEVGYSRQTLAMMLRREDTLFYSAFKEAEKKIAQDPRVTKVAGIERLLRYIEEAEKEGNYEFALKCQKELSLMVEGNIAPKTTIEKKDEKIEIKVIDFTQRAQLPKSNIIPIDDVQEAEEV